MQNVYKSGIGYDVHQLVEGRKCIIGGVDIPYEKGLLGHSDADVLIHAISDALLGAIGLGDIGSFFPDKDPQFKGMDSSRILEFIVFKMKEQGYSLINVDSIIIAQAPKMGPHITEMKKNIAKVLNVQPQQIGIKATTTEKLGFTGRKEGIAAQATVSVYGPLFVE